MLFFFFCIFLRLLSKEVQGFGQIVARKEGGDSLFGSVCDPEELQAVENEKMSVLITSYKAALIPFNNPIGAHPCRCQTAVSAPLCFPPSSTTIFTN